MPGRLVAERLGIPPRRGAGSPRSGWLAVRALNLQRSEIGWPTVDIELNFPQVQRCKCTSRVVDPLDSRIRRQVRVPVRDWTHAPLRRPLIDRPAGDTLLEAAVAFAEPVPNSTPTKLNPVT